MRRKWMPFALAAIIAASAAITPVYADDPPSGSLPSSFEGYRLLEHIVLENGDMKAVNSAERQAVLPKTVTDRDQLQDGILQSKLSKTSWNVIRLGR